ncbi:MAG TPA: mechanosensitive ion channel [Candidatus Hydrogenedentes bacterium]|nr:mechanosensitive ion channel [Candidatus Hydrogenedentota bacterium]
MKHVSLSLTAFRLPRACPGMRWAGLVSAHRHIGGGLLLLFLCAAFSAATGQEPAAPADTTAEGAAIAEEGQPTGRIQAVQDELATLPEAPEVGSPEAQRKATLQKLLGLLQQYETDTAALAVLQTKQPGIEERAAQAAAALEELKEAPEPATPTEPTKEGLEALRQEAKGEREKAQALQKEIVDTRQRQETSFDRLSQARSTLDEAVKAIARFTEEAAKAQDPKDKALFTLSAEAAEIEKQLAEMAIKMIEAQADLDAKLEPVLQQEADAAEMRATRLEQELVFYEESLKDQLADEQRQLDQDLADKEKTAAEATTPSEIFLATAEAGLAASRKSNAELQTALIALGKDIGEQEKRLSAEKAELESLRVLLSNPDVGTMARERIRETMAILKLRRRTLGHSLNQEDVDDISHYRSRRYEVENLLFEFTEKQEMAVPALAEALPEQDRAAFTGTTREILGEWRAALREERTALTEAISLSQKMQDMSMERLKTLNEAEQFVRARALWIRDAQPIRTAFLGNVGRELLKVSQLAHKAVATDALPFFLQLARYPSTIFFIALVVLVFPLILLYLKRKTGQFLAQSSIESERVTGTLKEQMRRGSVALLNAVLVPAYFLVAAYAVLLLDLPDDLRVPFSTFCVHGAYCILAWSLVSRILNKKGIFGAYGEQYGSGICALRRSLRLIILTYILCLLPAVLLTRPPAELEVLPRILRLVFMGIAAVTLAWLLRPHSHLTASAVNLLQGPLVRRLWSLASIAMPLLLASAFALDAMGFRYASQTIAVNLGISLLIVSFFAIAYLGVRQALPLLSPPPDTADEVAFWFKARQHLGTVTRLVNTVFLILVLVALSLVWGIDEQALGTLEEIHLYSLRGVGDEIEFVTGADIVWFAVYLLVMTWLLRYLPGIYDFAIFPRLRLDEGAKYAILTISRYGIFIVGIVLALSQIHLDLSRLGWLIAAIGVGLGFGLQEIVSNFFSGLILLVERPIRIHDVVTIGDTTGEVRRINIRATTIRNWDRQEVVLPNRDLITRAVTNWTRGDTVNRLVVEIGVAYGSDVQLVTDTLYKIAEEDPDVLNEPESVVTFENHGDSALLFVLRVFLPSPSVRLATLNRLNVRINKEFNALGIEIPFPQHDIHIRSNATTPQEPGPPSS